MNEFEFVIDLCRGLIKQRDADKTIMQGHHEKDEDRLYFEGKVDGLNIAIESVGKVLARILANNR